MREQGLVIGLSRRLREQVGDDDVRSGPHPDLAGLHFVDVARMPELPVHRGPSLSHAEREAGPKVIIGSDTVRVHLGLAQQHVADDLADHGAHRAQTRV